MNMFLKNNYRIVGTMLLAVLFNSCQKWDDYRKYTAGGEKVYPGIGSAVTRSGRNRLVLDWALSSDPNVSGYTVYWNNGADSLAGPVPPNAIGDSLHIRINDLPEGNYNLKLYTIDKTGHLSVPLVLSGRTFGPGYENGLLNRLIKSSSYNFFVQNVYTSWNIPDTVNTNTRVVYTGTDNLTKIVSLRGDSINLVLDNWKEGTMVYYQSYYKPNALAIDTFMVLRPDSLKMNTPAQAIFGAVGARNNYRADSVFTSADDINLDKKLKKTATQGIYECNDVANMANYPNTKIFLTLNPDNTIDVSGYVSGASPVGNHPTAGKSYYDPVAKKIYLRYKYTNSNRSYQLMEEIWTPK